MDPEVKAFGAVVENILSDALDRISQELERFKGRQVTFTHWQPGRDSRVVISTVESSYWEYEDDPEHGRIIFTMQVYNPNNGREERTSVPADHCRFV